MHGDAQRNARAIRPGNRLRRRQRAEGIDIMIHAALTARIVQIIFRQALHGVPAAIQDCASAK